MDQTSKTGSISLGSGHHVEEPITTFVESIASYTNPLFTNPLDLPLTDPPSMRYIDAYSSYNLPPGSTTTQTFGMNPPIFVFLEGLESLPLSTTHVVNIVGASPLLGTLVIQVTPTKPPVNTSSFAHGLGNIRASLFPHQVLYLVVPLVTWLQFNSFTQPRSHKLINLHIKPYR